MSEFTFQAEANGMPVTVTAQIDAHPLDMLHDLEHLEFYFDAGTRGGNPGESGIAVYAAIDIPDDKHFLYHLRVTELIGICTNNQAEWMALIKALEIAEQNAPVLRKLAVRSDSLLVVKQALGKWRVRGHLRELHARSQALAQTLVDRGCSVTIEHVPRDQNADADRLVTDLLDTYLGCPRGY